jgi:hypothetical protein
VCARVVCMRTQVSSGSTSREMMMIALVRARVLVASVVCTCMKELIV